MARAWPQLSQLLARLMLVIGLSEDRGPERIPRALRVQVLRLLRPAEALARRLIVLMAREVHLERHPGRPQGGPGPSAVTRKVPDHAVRVRDDASISTFTFFEPLCTRRRRPAPQRPAGPGPRILSLDALYPACPTQHTADDASAAPLIARLRGLKRVLERPETYAMRHAVFLRHKETSNALPGRLSPIRPGWPPGRRSPHTPPWLADMLAHFTSEIRRGPPRTRRPALPDHTLRPAAPQAGA